MVDGFKADILEAAKALRKLADSIGCDAIEAQSVSGGSTVIVWSREGRAGTALVDLEKGQVYLRQ